MKKIHPLLFFLFISANLFSQKQTNVWYFGVNAGVEFNSATPQVLTDGNLVAFEGASTISDKNGNLLFYCDGFRIWNKAHVVMDNGDSIINPMPSHIMPSSSTQSSIIIPQPCNPNIYYVFTTDAYTNHTPSGFYDPSTWYLTNLPFSYSIVDLSYNGGLGKVILKKQFLFSPTQEKVSAVRHANGRDVWIVARKAYTSDFYSYLLTNTGLSGPFISNSGTSTLDSTEGNGQMKISPDGTKIASICYSYVFPGKPGSLQIFDFNDATGLVSNPFTVANEIGYGLEFSPDNSLIYFTSSNSLKQYKISNGVKTTISFSANGSLQVASNDKIYTSQGSGSGFLGVINSPNTAGVGCSYNPSGINLQGKLSGYGLPNFMVGFKDTTLVVKARYTYSGTCIGDTTMFTNTSSNAEQWNWDLGDGSTSSAFDPKHYFSDTGTYAVKLTVADTCAVDSLISYIKINPLPPVNLGPDTLICTGNSIILNTDTGFIYSWSPTNESTSSITIYQAGTYVVNVTDTNGCQNTDSVKITEPIEGCGPKIFIPNSISPNGDGLNDVFLPALDNATFIRMSIYNRWGELIFVTNNPTGWNGEYKNEKAPEGVYIYQLIYSSNETAEKTEIGAVLLIR